MSQHECFHVCGKRKSAESYGEVSSGIESHVETLRSLEQLLVVGFGFIASEPFVEQGLVFIRSVFQFVGAVIYDCNLSVGIFEEFSQVLWRFRQVTVFDKLIKRLHWVFFVCPFVFCHVGNPSVYIAE